MFMSELALIIKFSQIAVRVMKATMMLMAINDTGKNLQKWNEV